MMKFVFALALSFLATFAIAQTEIKLEDVRNHIGDSVKIRAKIYGGKYLESAKGSPTFLNVGNNYPNAPLTLVIWGNVRKKFSEAPEDAFKDKEAWITGRLMLYKDKPEIIIYNPDQIVQVVEAPIGKGN